MQNRVSKIDIIGRAIDTALAYAKSVNVLLMPKANRFPAPQGKHLLLLTWAFPPDVTGGVYRPLSIVRGAKNRGWRVTVISGYSTKRTGSAGEYLGKYARDADSVIRLEKPKLRPSQKLFLPTIDGGFLNLLGTIELASTILANDSPSLILASGPSFHNFVVARELSKKFGVPYVLDYRDEWTECPFEIVDTGNLDRYFEEKCLRDASKIIFTTYSHLIHQQSCFNMLNPRKTVVVPNGWEAADAPDETISNPLGHAELRLVFVGYLSEHTLPRQFLKSLEQCIEADAELLRKIRIAFVGGQSLSAVNQLREFMFPQLLETLDVVPKPVALKIMKDADGLILINEHRLSRYRPGKLYDYISMRSPILVYGKGGEVGELVERLHAGVVVSADNHEELGAALAKLKTVKSLCRSPEVDLWLSNHTRSTLADKFMDELESTVA